MIKPYIPLFEMMVIPDAIEIMKTIKWHTPEYRGAQLQKAGTKFVRYGAQTRDNKIYYNPYNKGIQGTTEPMIIPISTLYDMIQKRIVKDISHEVKPSVKWDRWD